MRQKVNIYYAGFKHRVGGAFFHVVNIEKGLKELGYEIDIITLDRLPLLIRYIPHIVERLGNILKFPFGFIWRQKITKLFYKMIFNNSSNIEIFEDIYTYWKSDVKSIVILHALWSDNLQAFNTLEENRINLEKEEIRIINNIETKIVTVSKPYQDFLLSRLEPLGLKKSIEVVELGVDTDKFNKYNSNIQKEKSFIYVGSLEARKNIYFLLKVFNRLQNISKNEFTLTLVGDGPQENELKIFVSNKNIKNVYFKGRLNYDEVIKELPNHKYYLHTSTKESFSYSLLEAKLSDLVTIAYGKLEVPSEFIDIKNINFDVELWVNNILNFNKIEINFEKEKYTYQNMTKKTLEKVL